MDTGCLPPFETQFSLGGGGGGGGGDVHSLAGRYGILWGGSQFLPANSGVKTENKRKVFSAKS